MIMMIRSIVNQGADDDDMIKRQQPKLVHRFFFSFFLFLLFLLFFFLDGRRRFFLDFLVRAWMSSQTPRSIDECIFQPKYIYFLGKRRGKLDFNVYMQ